MISNYFVVVQILERRTGFCLNAVQRSWCARYSVIVCVFFINAFIENCKRARMLCNTLRLETLSNKKYAHEVPIHAFINCRLTYCM